jgi:uncharacterized protein
VIQAVSISVERLSFAEERRDWERRTLACIDPVLGARLRIAVIGAGVSGLSAAWLLSQRHDVTLYEKDARLGGHANTIEVAAETGAITVDTGFIVYNPPNYPNLTELFHHLEVDTESSDMSFSVSLDGGAFEYGGNSFSSLFAQKSNLVSPRFWSMLRGLLKFYREAPYALAEVEANGISLGEYLMSRDFSEAFQNDHLLPMAGAIWSAAPDNLRDYPAAAFIRFFKNHGLLDLAGRPAWRSVKGGSSDYVNRLAQRVRGNRRLRTPVRSISRSETGAVVTDNAGQAEGYDRVVIAAHADQALALLQDPSAKEVELLGAFKYTSNAALLHTDTRLMPKRRRVWSSWNFIGSRRFAMRDICVSYWMNRLQKLRTDRDLFVTLNPGIAPAEGTILHSEVYEHPLFDAKALIAQRQLSLLQGQRNTWFCGAYFGAGFHEDGLKAGLDVAEALGGVTRPWNTACASPLLTNQFSPALEPVS